MTVLFSITIANYNRATKVVKHEGLKSIEINTQNNTISLNVKTRRIGLEI